MKSYNINSNIIEWTKHYLSNRTQYVELNGVKSESRNVVSGIRIPQGSVLGPLLFLIYINDLPDNVKSTIYIMYADDTKVYREIDSDTDVQTLQEDLRIMSEWSNKWLKNNSSIRLMRVYWTTGTMSIRTKINNKEIN